MAKLQDELFQAVRLARSKKSLTVGDKTYNYIDISQIPGAEELPRALYILLENCVRRATTDEEAALYADRILSAAHSGTQGEEIEFMPSRVLFQDFTGVPVFVDFAAMRDAMATRGGDPTKVNPKIPCTLIVDHSVIADKVGAGAAQCNEHMEATRNRERFAFLKWAANSFDNVRIVPPGVGICHQLNMERFSEVVSFDALGDKERDLCFDTLVGTDSHTTTANGMGVLGWGVGGIEAEAAALGQSISMLVPPVVNLVLDGALQDGISGMDVALKVAKLLREEGVVGSFVEVTGKGVESLSATQRACISNMTPEYGATTVLFPVDRRTLDYMALTGRTKEHIALVEAYLKAQNLDPDSAHLRKAHYSKELHLNLSEVKLSLAGPSRPHDNLYPSELKERFRAALLEHGRTQDEKAKHLEFEGSEVTLTHGALAIAAITSCTTATDPAMMIAAGLCAKKAKAAGLVPKAWVKKVFAPGSHATKDLLERAGLLSDLEALGFAISGYGCMSCIGNSGPIDPKLHELAAELELCSILSGNRNFEGRISPDVSQNYLAQPALVVAYSLCGTLDIDATKEPLATVEGKDVYLSDILPTTAEIEETLAKVLDSDLYLSGKDTLFVGSSDWQEIPATQSATFDWDESSSYVRRAPYFDIAKAKDNLSLSGCRVLAKLGDFVTTDHISPAGSIASDSEAAKYLEDMGVSPKDFNTYGSRRGNHEVMVRGTFANVKLQNDLAKGKRAAYTLDFSDDQIKSMYAASKNYEKDKRNLIVIAGKMYGSGSSRDWAAKGPALLGVKAVLAESFERIHRSNLVQMGILPLQFIQGQNAQSLGLDGSEIYTIAPIDLEAYATGTAKKEVVISCMRKDGMESYFPAIVRIDTATEARFIAEGGILPYVLESLISK